jgi:hypothetical protein
MSWTCHVVHRVPGRIRLKLPRGRVEGVQLDNIARAIEQLPGVQRVMANPLTASLLIHHDGPAPALIGALDAAGLAVETGSPFPALEDNAGGLLLSPLLRMSTPGASLPYDLLFLLLAGLAARQAVAGHLMAPAVTLLWYAFQLRRMQETGGAPVSA